MSNSETSTANAPRENLATSGLAFIALCLSVACYLNRESLGGPMAAMTTGVIFSFVGALCLVINKTTCLKDRNWFSVDILFYASFWILHHFLAFLWCARGEMPLMGSFADHAMPYIARLPQVTLLSACGGLAFVLAFLRYSRPRTPHRKSRHNELWYSPRARSLAADPTLLAPEPAPGYSRGVQLQILHALQLFAIVVSLAALALNIRSAGADFFNSSYSGAPDSYLSGIANLLFMPFFRVGLVVLVVCVLMEGFKTINVLSTVYYASVMMFYLVIGDRDPVALAGTSVLIVLGTLRYNFRWWQLILALVLGSIFFLIAGDARTSEKRTLGSFVERGIQAQKEKDSSSWTPYQGIQEYAETALPALLMAVHEIPVRTPYFNGYFATRGLLTSVPFYSKVFPFMSAKRKLWSSADFITLCYFPDSPGTTGMGSTIVVEAYMDLGLPGVLAAMFVAGAVAGVCYRRIRRRPLPIDSIVVYAICASNLVVGVRAGLASTLARDMLWPILIYFFLKAVARSVTMDMGRMGQRLATPSVPE